MNAKRVDTNHREIVQKLRQCGFQVIDMAKVGDTCPDLLVCGNRKTGWVMLEIKTQSGRISKGQMEFLAKARGYVGVATTFEEAFEIAKFPSTNALSGTQQSRIDSFLVRFDGKAMAYNKFKNEVLEG